MSTDPSIAIRSELRKAALSARDGISEELRDAYSQLIRKKTIEYLDSLSVRFVHSYIGFQSEVGTRAIIEDLFQRGVKIAVPLTRGEGSDQRMIHSLLEDLDHLHSGKFGVPEPDTVKEISIRDIDAVLLPIVAFDGFGMRLGYGKGFYDRFLVTFPAKVRRIGLAFSIQEVDKIPMMPHDQLINNVITEQSNFIFD